MSVPAKGLRAGDHARGIAAVFQRELSMPDEPPRLELVDQLGSDNHPADTAKWTDNAGRQTVVARVEAGRLAEVWFLPEDQAMFDAFFTEAGAPVVSEPGPAALRNRD